MEHIDSKGVIKNENLYQPLPKPVLETHISENAGVISSAAASWLAFQKEIDAFVEKLKRRREKALKLNGSAK